MKMMLKVGFIALALIFISFGQQLNENYSFQDYMRQFQRNYTGEEKEMRRKIFEQSYRKDLEHNKDPNRAYTSRVNKFTDWTDKQIQDYQKGKVDPELKFSSYKPLRGHMLGSGLTTLNYNTRGKVTEVRDQSSCGSCWAFAAVAQYESLLLIHEQKNYDLAEQYVLSCSGGGNCQQGGFAGLALKNFKDSGIATEASMPYSATNGNNNTCSYQSKIKLNNTVKSYNCYRDLSDAELRQVLIDYGPVSIAIYATNSLMRSYSSGIWSCQSYYSTNHNVLLVGYTSDGDWIIKNSWGEDWGENGYVTISKDKNCGVTTEVDVLQVQHGSDTNFEGGSSTETVSYTVSMIDSASDGWDSCVLGFRQNGVIVEQFGRNFKYSYGSSYGPITVQLPKGKQTEIVVVSIGLSYYTFEKGFTVKDNNGNVEYDRPTGTSFTTSTIFHTFCAGCQSVSHEQTVYITLKDSYGDGWEGNQLALKNTATGDLFPFGQNFTSGYLYDVIEQITVPKYVVIQVVPHIIKKYTYEMEFSVKDSNGVTIVQRSSGSSFYANYILGEFCLGCLNYNPPLNTEIVEQEEEQEKQKISENKKTQIIVNQETDSSKSMQIIMVLAIVLGIMLSVLVLGGVYIVYLTKKGMKQDIQLMNCSTNQTLPAVSKE